jgi:hypothetical protein
MKNNGKSITKILLLWLIVVAIGTISSAIGFSILANINNKDIVSIALSYASGAILVMLAESMIPEAFEEGGSKIGLAAMAGFVVAFVLGRLGGAQKKVKENRERLQRHHISPLLFKGFLFDSGPPNMCVVRIFDHI